MSTLAVRPEIRLARPLKVLVPLIQEDIKEANKAGLDFYRAAGEKLKEAQSQVSGSVWKRWVQDNFQIGLTQAYAWMRLAGQMEFRQDLEDQSDSELRPAAKPQQPQVKRLSDITHPGRDSHQPRWHAPVQQVVSRVDVSKMREHLQDREKEKKLRRKLGFELIDIGYKVLATKLHPDHGGSPEAMARLNDIRDILKGAL